jgi:5-methylcytosine-specific restriction endonuclease McrA
MSKTIKAIYGNATILKQWCPRCNGYYFIIDGKLQCCGKKVEDYGKRFTKKRESEGSLVRGHLSARAQKEIIGFQAGECVYCGTIFGKKNHPVFDHFVCFVSSGDNSIHNFVASCGKCNSIKGSLIFKTIEEARVYITQRRESKGLPVYEYYGGSYDVKEQ